jgi:transcriptional regulatory protein RtcR
MATLSIGGRISVETVEEEIGRLAVSWADPKKASDEETLVEVLGPERAAQMDLFDRAQLNQVLEVCARSRSLSEAGRILFSASIGRKASTNDADRLRKYLARFGLDWAEISGAK